MPTSQQTDRINIPVRLVFTEEGVAYFMQRQRHLQRFRLSDTRDEYGIELSDFSPPTLQKLLRSGYVSKIEVPVANVTARRAAIIDLTKLLTYGMLYREFETTTFRMMVNSDMVRHWNRRNVRHPIDFQTPIDTAYLAALLQKNSSGVAEVRREIMEPVQDHIRLDTRIAEEDKRLRLFTADRYLDNMNPLSWFVLSVYRNTEAYAGTIMAIREELLRYLDKTRIGEYLALLLLEVLTTAREHGRASGSPEGAAEEMFLLFTVKKQRQVEHDRGRLHVVVADTRANFEDMERAIREKSRATVGRRSLNDFYEAAADGEHPIDLGLYYLSFMQEACREVDVRFQSYVHQLGAAAPTLVNLVLTL